MPNLAAFLNRWRITGTLTTTSPLHIGDGFPSTSRILKADGKDREVQTVCVDIHGKPFIPASAFKGPLRAWLKRNGHFDARWERLLGSDSDKLDGPHACGGQLGFWDAPLRTSPTFSRQNPPYWNSNRGTAVAVSVSIDRRSRTALARHLFHIEYVPVGTVFDFEVTAQNLSQDDIAHLLGLLELFAKDDSLTLGAHEIHDWGKMRWSNPKVYHLDSTDLARRLETQEPISVGFAAADSPTQVQPIVLSGTAKRLTIDITLHFDSPLLARDPAAGEEARARNARLPKDDERREPEALPQLDQNGDPFLPARSVRGVLRSRVEMILRTLGQSVPPPHEAHIVRSLADLTTLDFASRIFGASGWRAPVRCPKFVLKGTEKASPRRQDFVANDRFTGGSAGSKKFAAKPVLCDKPIGKFVLGGTLIVDLQRLAIANADDYGPGLLALMLRDLVDGDLQFGSGSSKGQGACTAEVLWDGQPLMDAAVDAVKLARQKFQPSPAPASASAPSSSLP